MHSVPGHSIPLDAAPLDPVLLDPDVCYRALQTRDARFDGRFFTAVSSTGIYCRPICPARTPMRKHCRFFASAAAAEQAGFRACLRCRPEIAPQSPAWRGTASTVSRAMARIAEGALDGPDASVERLAATLGVGQRQLRRLFDQHVGASPLAVAQTRRVLFAKQLIHETRLPMASVAMAAGFGSIRRFNDTFRALYKRPPSQLRRRAVTTSSAAPLILRLSYRLPFDWNALLGFFTPRAIPGVEEVREGIYRRVVRVDDHVALIAVSHLPARNALEVQIACDHVPALPIIASRLRRVFDLDADTEAIAAHLSRDRALAPIVLRQPGLRTPGGWDPFEVAVRAILGQQISVAAARGLAAKLAALTTKPLALGDGALTHAFPTAQQIAAADLSALGMPAARRAALTSLARAAVERPEIFEAANTLEESIARLRSIPGIGEWTAQYIALRGLHHPDAFPASDIGILRNAEQLFGTPLSPAQLLARSEEWRPWRGYAAQHLWSASSVSLTLPQKPRRATAPSPPTSALQTRPLPASNIAATGGLV
ncbi:MAG TPA: AlkA N-terminal domain-containing protein [Acidobacteriaceae bacterium]|jgi:AraC family transcriptional regulator of adaptative response / DNA-3-methyladenine glycosylase II